MGHRKQRACVSSDIIGTYFLKQYVKWLKTKDLRFSSRNSAVNKANQRKAEEIQKTKIDFKKNIRIWSLKYHVRKYPATKHLEITDEM